MKNKNYILAKTAILLMGACGLAMCAYWYPFSIKITAGWIDGAVITPEQYTEFWTQLIFYWVVSIPCFIILAIAWKISDAIKRETIFSRRTARLIKNCITIFLVDEVVFFIGNFVFWRLDWNAFAVLYLAVGVMGFVVSGLTYIISHYIIQAAALKEEVEGTI